MKRAILFSSLVVLAALPSFASVIDLITIDSSSLAPGTTGFIDLAFNGGFPATATISGFSITGGSLDPAQLTTQGTVSGTLPGAVTLHNDNADFDDFINFGSSIRFVLTLAGTPGGLVGDVFTLSFFNSTFTGGLLTGNVNDFWIVQYQMDTTGNVTSAAYANPSGGPSFASIATVPEPASAFSAGMALLAGWAARRLVGKRGNSEVARQDLFE